MNSFWSRVKSVAEIKLRNSISGSFGSMLGSALGGSGGGSVGSLGDISFEVSAYNQIHTIEDYKRSAKASLADHKIIGSKPLTEFTGPELQSISFSCKLHAEWGVNPATEMEKLISYCESGEVLTFVLGSKSIGQNKWLIESVSEAAKYFDTSGNILYSVVDISLHEYVENGSEGGVS